MNVRCNYCGSSFNLSRDYIAQAVAEAQDKKMKSHAMNCLNCRKTLKIPIKQMRRFVPKTQDKAATADQE